MTQQFKTLIGRDRFFSLLLLVIFILAVIGLAVPKIESFFWLNSYHSTPMENAFRVYTYFGDGLFSILLAVLLFLFKKRLLGFQILVSFLASGILAQVVKRIAKMPRPQEILAGSYMHFIEGHSSFGWDSFPSGHTISAFALATLLGLHTRNHFLQVVYFLLALLVAFSRIYLGNHFLNDCSAGALIGMITSLAVYAFIPLPRFMRIKKEVDNQSQNTDLRHA